MPTLVTFIRKPQSNSNEPSHIGVIIESLRIVSDALKASNKVGRIRQKTHAPKDGLQTW